METFESKDQKGVTVTTSGGEKIDADCVVCTVPLGVLRARTINFDPPLPERKSEAIDKLGFGVLNKCAMSFPTKFWDDKDFLGRFVPASCEVMC